MNTYQQIVGSLIERVAHAAVYHLGGPPLLSAKIVKHKFTGREMVVLMVNDHKGGQCVPVGVLFGSLREQEATMQEYALDGEVGQPNPLHDMREEERLSR